MTEQKRIALVTGATRGIGKAIALELAKQGATVIGTATSETGAESISAYLSAAGNSGTGIVLNVTNSESIQTALAQIEEKFGAPEILVNNAGITRDNLLLRMKDEEWDDVIATNLTAINPGLIEAGMSFGATPLQILLKILLRESLPALINGITLMLISLIGYSAMAGAVGGGGLGTVAINYGYQRFDVTIMLATVAILIIIVHLIQYGGNRISRYLIRQ